MSKSLTCISENKTFSFKRSTQFLIFIFRFTIKNISWLSSLYLSYEWRWSKRNEHWRSYIEVHLSYLIKQNYLVYRLNYVRKFRKKALNCRSKMTQVIHFSSIPSWVTWQPIRTKKNILDKRLPRSVECTPWNVLGWRQKFPKF